MSPRVPPRVATPIGAAWDPDLTVRENAERAWSAARETIQRQREVGAKLALRRAFGLQEPPEFFYLARFQRLPLCEIGEDLIGYNGKSLFLAARCSDCGEEIRNEGDFLSLADYGEMLDAAAERPEFTCGDCKQKAAVAEMLKGGRR